MEWPLSNLWVIEATDTHPENLILTTFPPQKYTSERSSVLSSYAYCLFSL